MVAADGAIINHNIPCPKGYSIPLERVSENIVELVVSNGSTFLTSNLFLLSLELSAAAFVAFVFGAGASVISTSAMLLVVGWITERDTGKQRCFVRQTVTSYGWE